MAYATPEQAGNPSWARGPLSRSGRSAALDRACREAVAEFFDKAMRTRNWSPWHDVPVEEIKKYGHRLSNETVRLLEAFLAVEEYVGDYTVEGVEGFRDDRTRRNLHLQWGAEEMRHGLALEQVLLHSGVRTEQELGDYLAKAARRRWSHRAHPGMDGPLGACLYMMIQERATYVNYVALGRRIRAEYGLPIKVTPEEAARGRQFGAAEVLRIISGDEIAHHGIFLQIARLYLHYFPEATLDKLKEILAGFSMPGLRLVPDAREFLRLSVSTGIYDGEIYKTEVLMPILKALSLRGEPALARYLGNVGSPTTPL